jgi:hypothetical protein
MYVIVYMYVCSHINKNPTLVSPFRWKVVENWCRILHMQVLESYSFYCKSFKLPINVGQHVGPRVLM